MDGHAFNLYELPENVCQKVIDITESDGLEGFRREINQQEEDENLKFLGEILRSQYEAYASPFTSEKTEDTFNQLYIWPFLQAVANFAVTKNGNIGFQSGQTRLSSMSVQLKSAGIIVDDKTCYKTDGLISIFKKCKIEILLLETSGALNNQDKVKLNFDHHKAMFGLLAMIKTTAEEYQYASVEQFSRCKFFFLHGAGEELQLWSLWYQEGVFDFWRETTLVIKLKFEDIDEFLPKLAQFFWVVKCSLQQAVNNLELLQQEHYNKIKNNKFDTSRLPTLKRFINPIIMKLSQAQDSLGMGSLGPIYSPTHY